MQTTESPPPSARSYLLHAIVSALGWPLLIAIVAFTPWKMRPHEFQALAYGAAIVFPFLAAVIPPVALTLFLAGFGMARWLKRPWVAHPTVLVLLPLGYAVALLLFGKR